MIKNNLSHIAFILDGNKRWAKKNKLSNLDGYKAGFEKIKIIVDHCYNKNILNLTLFALSSENFKRPSINILYEIIYNNFSNLIDDLTDKKDIKINIFGNKENLPSKILNIFERAENLTKNNKSLNLNIAFNYGFRDEIKYVLENFKNNFETFNLEDSNKIRSLFYLGNIPDPDILIRTGGYQRLSNFIMYNLTYTEMFFSETLWPDFTSDELDQIIDKFANIKRTYGL